jgi:hypothetical protein
MDDKKHPSSENTDLKRIIALKTQLLAKVHDERLGVPNIDYSTVLGSDASSYRNFDPYKLKVGYIIQNETKQPLGCEIASDGSHVIHFF